MVCLGMFDGHIHSTECDHCKNTIQRSEQRWHCCDTDVCLACGTLLAGAAVGDVPSSSPSCIAQLKEIFPTWDDETLADVLAASGGSVEGATAALLQWSGEASDVVENVGGLPSECARPKLEPVSPWHMALRMPEAHGNGNGGSMPRAPLARLDFDHIMAQRLARHSNGSTLSEVLKVAAHWHHRASAHHVAAKHHTSTAVAAVPSPAHMEAQLKHTLDHLSREDAIVAGKELLRERCKFLGLRPLEMEDDGNCQFRAISQELFGTQAFHSGVREQAVSHLRRNPGDFPSFFEEGGWEDYLQKMTVVRTWGDEMTLRACAEAFGVRVHVVSSTEENWHLVYEPEGGVGPAARQLFLTYVSPIHYNSVAPLR